MRAFRRLIAVALAAGTLSGLVWFGLQYYTVIPLIAAAEKYEAEASHHHDGHGTRSNRNSLTAVTTVLTSIGFAAVLFGLLSLSGRQWNVKSGALWGLAAFASIGLAPALGLPPQPPGSALADLTSRQLWWVVTVAATGLGLYWIAGSAKRPLRITAGVVFLLLPHLIGAPAASGDSVVPLSIVRRFEVASLAAAGVFWLTLGALGGFLGKDPRRPE